MPYLTWLADAARETGYPVVEVPGWKTRGHGGMRAAHGVVAHWTAGPSDANSSLNYPSMKVVRDGRAGLPGPLSQIGIGFDGTIYVIAAGMSYHAGVSSWQGETNLNFTYIGIEAECPGNYAYTAAQNDVYARLCAALLRRMGKSSKFVAGHREVARPLGRKSDAPARDMNAFRAKVQSYLNNPSTINKVAKATSVSKPIVKPPVNTEENELNATEKGQLASAEKNAAAAVAAVAKVNQQFDAQRAGSLVDKLNRTGLRLADVQTEVGEVKTELEAVKALLTQVLAALPKPPTTIK